MSIAATRLKLPTRKSVLERKISLELSGDGEEEVAKPKSLLSPPGFMQKRFVSSSSSSVDTEEVVPDKQKKLGTHNGSSDQKKPPRGPTAMRSNSSCIIAAVESFRLDQRKAPSTREIREPLKPQQRSSSSISLRRRKGPYHQSSSSSSSSSISKSCPKKEVSPVNQQRRRVIQPPPPHPGAIRQTRTVDDVVPKNPTSQRPPVEDDLETLKAKLEQLSIEAEDVRCREEEQLLMFQELKNQKEKVSERRNALSKECDEFNSLINDANDNFESRAFELKRSVEKLGAQVETLATERGALLGDNENLKKGVLQTKRACEDLDKTAASLIHQHDTELQEEKKQLDKMNTLKTYIQQLESYARRIIQDASHSEAHRKRLHNIAQELRGNIRVICRIRPMSKVESQTCEEAHLEISSQGAMLLVSSGTLKSVDGISEHSNQYRFSFDKIFGSNASQSDVFEEISQLVQSALDGYKVAIFVYGQTGSGKTYTMEGADSYRLDEDWQQNKGVIPRSVELIFETISNLERTGWKFSIESSVIEIYNDTVRDLLSEKDDSSSSLEIKSDQKGNVYVANSTSVPVSDAPQVRQLLKKAQSSRAVAETKCNERSSRSHCIFQLRLNGANPEQQNNSKVSGLLSLIDLAGSERVDKAQVSGDRLKETQAINKSLSALGDVIGALGARNATSKGNAGSHIPYRNSKLTMLLKDSLGGDSKTLMFVNVNPLLQSVNETLNSLRFAAKVNACSVSMPKKNAGMTASSGPPTPR